MTSLFDNGAVPFNLWDEPTSPTIAPQSLDVPVPDVVFPEVGSRPSPSANRPTIAPQRPPLPRLSLAEQQALHLKAKNLRNFFRLFFDADQRIHFFPMMRPEVLDQQRLNPDFPEFIGRKRVRQWDYIPTRFREGISTCLGSSRFASAVRLLEEFNQWGYDIFWCINPLVCNRRLKIAVRKVIILCIESDLNTFAEQILAESALKGHIRASVFTGNKSIHFYVRIEPAIWNPQCITDWRMLRRYDSDKSPRIKLPEFESAIDAWQNLLAEHGFYSDWNVLSDFSRLSRAPFFINHKTGKAAELRTVNENAWWLTGTRIYWDESVGRDVSGGLGSVDQPVTSYNGGGQGAGIANTVGCPVNSVNLEAPATADTAGECCACTPVRTNVTIQSSPEPRRRTVLESLDLYESLKRDGIPGRGQRQALHLDLFAVVKVFDWDEERLSTEWRGIVRIKPQNIGCSEEQAVQDIVRHWKRSKARQTWLPDTTLLPDPTAERIPVLKTNLKRLGCDTSSSCARVIVEILYPLIRRLPRQCSMGTISILSREIQNRCVSKRSKEPLRWLHQANVLRVTDPDYVVGKTKRYFVNVTLVIWLLGFRSEDVSWDRIHHQSRGHGLDGEVAPRPLQSLQSSMRIS